MKKLYFMGIDNGGSTIKCAIFDQYGTKISSASARIPLNTPFDGFTERSTEDIWKANCRVIQTALKRSLLSPSEITALSLCGYGGGALFLNKFGQSVYPAIVSTDSRAEKLLHTFQKTGRADAVYTYTYQRLWSGQQGMLLPWFSKNHPDILEKSTYLLSIKDYIRYRLTDCFATEATDASNTNLFNIHTQSFDPEICRHLGVEKYFYLLPNAVLPPYAIAGEITQKAASETGLLPGTPVATGLYDVAACTLGSGILDETILSVIIGTWNICGHLSPSLKDCEGKNNGMMAFLDNWFFSEESSPTSASNLDWIIDHFFHLEKSNPSSIYQKCNDMVAALKPIESDVIFLPYLYGSNSIPNARAGFFNLNGRHTTGHLLMAVYEGIIFSLFSHMESLCQNNRPAFVRFSGGASRSPVWCQMLADILNTPIQVSECDELGALGAAICASIASGVYHDYSDSVMHMCHIAHTYTPNPKYTKIYEGKYLQYQKAIQSMRTFYSDI